MTVVSQVAVFNKSTGALSHTAPASLKPTDASLGWVALPAGYNDETYAWDTAARNMVEDAAKLETRLVREIKSEAERRKMLVRSPGSGKGAEYRIKRDEAAASGNIVAAALNALTRTASLQQYPAAAREAALTGETLATVLARYRDRSAATDAEVLRLAAIEQNATRLIRAATTPSAKRAAFQAVNWDWKP